MGKTRDYEASLAESLRDPEEAVAYLNAALEDDDSDAFLLALKDVADAQGGMAKAARDAELSRESLYRMLSDKGNPRVNSLTSVLRALGMRLAIERDDERGNAQA